MAYPRWPWPLDKLPVTVQRIRRCRFGRRYRAHAQQHFHCMRVQRPRASSVAGAVDLIQGFGRTDLHRISNVRCIKKFLIIPDIIEAPEANRVRVGLQRRGGDSMDFTHDVRQPQIIDGAIEVERAARSQVGFSHREFSGNDSPTRLLDNCGPDHFLAVDVQRNAFTVDNHGHVVPCPSATTVRDLTVSGFMPGR